jgi:hypothetical protein
MRNKTVHRLRILHVNSWLLDHVRKILSLLMLIMVINFKFIIND